MSTTYLPVDSIEVPEYVERAIDRVEDDLMRKSVERGGIQQPFIVVPMDARRVLVDGLTRLRIARVLKFAKVPVILDPLPDGEDLERYVKRIRFIVNHHRQDLLPSQEAELVEYFKRPPFSMSHKEIAKHLGLRPDTISNILAVKHYIAPVAKAVDAGTLTRQAARAFDGMSDRGQRALWKEHNRDLATIPGGVVHSKLRELYPPDKFPEYYRQPELISQRLNRKGGKRTGQKRQAALATQEKLSLLSSFKYEEVELSMCKAEIARLDRRRDAAIIPVRAILRNETLSESLSPDMRDELKAWAEIYAR